jgi:hypothetical protein
MEVPQARSVGVARHRLRFSISGLLGSFRIHLDLPGYEFLMAQQEKNPHLPWFSQSVSSIVVDEGRNAALIRQWRCCCVGWDSSVWL